MVTTVHAEPGQNILDICLQEYGSIDGLVELHLANGWESIPKEIRPGEAIVIPERVKQTTIVTMLSFSKPATMDSKKIVEVLSGGINYMGIEIDFIVS